MSLQKLMHRRKFIERSLLGAGGVLFTSAVLESCTLKDHVIPNPNGPVIMPPIGEYELDVNDSIKTAIVTGLSMIPVAGEILGGLTEIFWPASKKDVWSEIRNQLDTYVSDKIANDDYTLVGTLLTGLGGSLDLYTKAIAAGDIADTAKQWDDTRNTFVTALPEFQWNGHELKLLPLFAHAVTMYLGLLRDGILYGKEWGFNDIKIQQLVTDLQDRITNYTAYVNGWTQNGAAALQAVTKVNKATCEPFKSLNAYDRTLKLSVLDFRDTWPYFDATVYPAGAKFESFREVYSDPFGSISNSSNNSPISLPSVPMQLPTNVTVWGYNRIDAVQLTYPTGTGPGGVTQTARMGDAAGGSNQAPHGGVFNLAINNPITKVRAYYAAYQKTVGESDPIVGAMQFQFHDGTTTDLLGGLDKGAPGGWSMDTGLIGYDNNVLSSIYIHGIEKTIGSADCVVFGFQFWQSPQATFQAIGRLYITSPQERAATDFHSAFPHLGISAGSISNELKSAREAYWTKKRG
ncbi:insecticidal delta-endotoxin Cry8Ea1 family protein [Dyadobacter fermentans]|nr:insecticidal delta-endotoxin Cry8Ea1 family protein [Dyadobacter fermentans]